MFRIFLVAGIALFAQSPEWTAEQDHQNMMDQLGIKSLRPGPSGNESAPNHANYDEATANPFPDLPDVLRLNNGKPVKNAAIWWKKRRPEIMEDFEREVIGRVPANVPKVEWTVLETKETTVGPYPVISQKLNGHVGDVDIEMTLVRPAHSKAPPPVMMMFSYHWPANRSAPPPPTDTPATEQLIADGWAYSMIYPVSIQPDNGAGLRKGIIGIVNKGQPRKPEDWGALRAWAWGASRGLDYLETEKAVDAKHVGIEGVSRYGKAALIAMAFDPRFAVVLVGSSGEGGAKLHRRNWGEAVENLTGTGEYHWMAGNFLKYGGPKNPGDLPVDAHELIALCAPRPTFISYGIPEKGDSKWLDQQGSFMATVTAGRVFRLLGAQDLGVGDDYKNAKMPPVNQGLLNGQLAWRQHDGGHTDAPNWRYFIPWADRMLQHTPAPHATESIERTDEKSKQAHEHLLEKAKQGRVDIYLEGDSITRRWAGEDYPELLANYIQNFSQFSIGDFGWGGDKTENMLWRLDHGELDGVNPKIVVLLAGTNNVGNMALADPDAKVADVAAGVEAIIQRIRAKAPNAVIILTAIFPRNDNMAAMPVIDKINARIVKLCDGKTVRWLNINDKLADSGGVLYEGMMMDKLHPTVKGYQVWADALKPVFREILGY